MRLLLGEEALTRLDSSFVAVIGLGGVGGSCAEALVRGGVGRLLFVDSDDVEPSNLNRQAIAFLSTIGLPKTEVMEQMAHDINAEAEVHTRRLFLDEGNIEEAFTGLPKPDHIVDAIDTLTAKAALVSWANEAGVPIVSSMGMANRKDPTKLRFADVFQTSHCPLSKKMRKLCRERGIQKLDVLYSTERPLQIAMQDDAQPDGQAGHRVLGTFSYMPPIAGQMLAGFVIQALLGLRLSHQ